MCIYRWHPYNILLQHNFLFYFILFRWNVSKYIVWFIGQLTVVFSCWYTLSLFVLCLSAPWKVKNDNYLILHNIVVKPFYKYQRQFLSCHITNPCLPLLNCLIKVGVPLAHIWLICAISTMITPYLYHSIWVMMSPMSRQYPLWHFFTFLWMVQA